MSSLPPLSDRLPANLTTFHALLTAPERTEDLVVVTFWTIVSLYGWVANTVVMISILVHPDLRSRSCYWLIFTSCLCDFSMLLSYFFLILPLFAFHERFYAVYSDANFIAFFIYQIFYYAGLFLLVSTGVNRLLCLVFPLGYTTLFTFNRTVVLATGCMCIGFCAASVNLLPCCRAYTDPVTYSTVYPEDSWFIEYDLALTLTLCICSVSLYVAILCFIRRHARKMTKHVFTSQDRGRASNRRAENILTIQCAVICGFNITASSSWDIVPIFSETRLTFIILNSLFLLDNCAASSVHLMTNSSLRRGVRRSFGLNSNAFTRIVSRVKQNISN